MPQKYYLGIIRILISNSHSAPYFSFLACLSADRSLASRFLLLASCLSALVSCFSLVKQIPTNPQIQERAVAGVVWSDEIAFLSHQTGIQVIVLEEHASSVDSEVKE